MGRWTMLRRMIPAVFFIIGVCLIHALGIMDSIAVPSYRRVIYIPLAYWSLVLFYLSLYQMLIIRSFSGFANTFRRGVVFGFCCHIYILLIDLIASLTKDHSFLSSAYFYYIEAIGLISTFLISIAAAIFIKKAGEYHRSLDKAEFLFMPIFLMPIPANFMLAHSLSETYLLSCAVLFFAPHIIVRTLGVGVIRNRVTGCAAFFWREKNFIVILFFLALAVRCFFSVNVVSKTEARQPGQFILASDDGDTYDKAALEIAKDPAGTIGKKFRVWGGYFDYGYAIFIAGIYKVFGRNFFAVTFIQSILGAFLPVAVYLLGKVLFSRATGAVAGFAMAIKNPVVFLSVVLGHEAIWMPVFVVFILALSYAYKERRYLYRGAAMAGLALGFVCVFRGLFINLIPFTAIWMVLFWKEKNVRDRVLAAGAFCLVAALVIGLASAVFHSPLSSGSKDRVRQVWEGNHLYDQFEGIGNDQLINIGINFAADGPAALKTIVAHPVAFAKVALRIYPLRIIGYFSANQFGFFDLLYLVNSAKVPNSFMSNLEFYFTLFFLIGLILCLKRSALARSPLFMILAFIILIFSILFIHITPRQRGVSTPFIYLIGSYGLIKVAGWLKVSHDRQDAADKIC